MPAPANNAKPPAALARACLRWDVRPTRWLLIASVARQRLRVFEQFEPPGSRQTFPSYHLKQELILSTSRFGTGQIASSNQTPLGLHRIAKKIGAGHPVGTVFASRRAVGLISQGHPRAPIAHRILWLEGLEPGFNRGGEVDTYARYIYIHGIGDESTLGCPASRGCLHLAAADLLPLFDLVPGGTLVWISRR